MMPQPTKSGKIEKKKKITDYTVKNQDKPEIIKIPLSTKRTSSALSPSENPQQAKGQYVASGKGTRVS